MTAKATLSSGDTMTSEELDYLASGQSPGPYRFEYGAIYHEDQTGFLFHIPEKVGDLVAKALNLSDALPRLLATAHTANPATGGEARPIAHEQHWHEAQSTCSIGTNDLDVYTASINEFKTTPSPPTGGEGKSPAELTPPSHRMEASAYLGKWISDLRGREPNRVNLLAVCDTIINIAAPPPTGGLDREEVARLKAFADDHGPTLAPYKDHAGFDQHDRLRADLRILLADQIITKASDSQALADARGEVEALEEAELVAKTQEAWIARHNAEVERLKAALFKALDWCIERQPKLYHHNDMLATGAQIQNLQADLSAALTDWR